ncbi:ketopantoate reductase family protein [Polynucleobacter kasalickyi]|uniref:2-dehydropantoate 2-reductase n=1 Tax=Polynucleobacter kasalickyi TaxID=1938817 RepID=A0A1W2A5P3_9BURK|nr:ketopantoate reductase C-terminal domain-containing protein [Polynucleobacter kasalickyi]SMC55792.1 ketopantoate reductase [Polynucleobacter kasalickyi]
MKTLVYGAGAIGSWLTAELTKANQDVCVLARGENLRNLREHGVTYGEMGGEQLQVPIRCIDPHSTEKNFDIIFVTLKSMQIADAAEDIMSRLSSGGSLVMIQNGLPWWYFSGIDSPWSGRVLQTLDPDGSLTKNIPVESIVGAVIFRPVIKVGPTQYVLPKVPKSWLSIGEVDNQMRPRLLEIEKLVTSTGFGVQVVSDIRKAKWQKLLRNIVWNTLCTIGQSPPGRYEAHPYGAEIVQSIMHESLAITKQLGIELDISPASELLSAKGDFKSSPSMQQDIRAGRPLESAAIIKVVIEMGEILKIPTPTLRMISLFLDVLDQTAQAEGGGIRVVGK